ncbi:serine protease [Paenirhodobacter sp. CAU 1674]|uniref:serine protease n=1 Tax=Paenirhodobacter sp. CAU 1674 TaxID=3032596 RepID=UPI0023DBAE3F|nr:serine protease [Paenirhodobacter sp. CAU 1674]MDF2141670.1 serine protease [Paenirhodobacter sp. CAU 1674]
MKSVRRAISAVVGAGLTGMIWTGLAWAEPAWIQIEARPSLAAGEERARDWARSFPDVVGFAMNTGWYAIALGPFYSPETAQAKMRLLRSERMIPLDSYVSDGSKFGQQFWPVGAGLSAVPEAPAPVPPVTPDAQENAPEPEAAAPAPVAETAPEPASVETLSRSRQLEAALTREQRMEIQAALQWQGVYSGAIDGAFGRGTRGSIAAWQTAQGFEPTGVLSSAQQAQLLLTVATERKALGLTLTEEPEAGIAIELPLGLVEFDHYDPPFVHYRAKDGSGVTVLLISQQGDQNALFGLYDVMQTLEIVPMEGPRNRERDGFTLTGQNAQIHSYTQAKLAGGLIKGFTLVYPADQEARMARVLAAMKASFKPLGGTALDATLGKPLAVDRADLLSGLNVRHPEFAHSGFYVDDKGAVLTAAAGLDTCARITVEDQDVDLAFADMDLGIAVLTPRKPLAPARVAAFQTAAIGPGSEVAVAGFSYPESLSAPVLSFGTLSDLTGLAGEVSQARLAARVLPGDVGGPVLDTTGAVIGMLLPDAHAPDKLLPGDLAVAVQSAAMAPALAERGFAPLASDASGALAAEDLAEIAQGLTVQIACWK